MDWIKVSIWFAIALSLSIQSNGTALSLVESSRIESKDSFPRIQISEERLSTLVDQMSTEDPWENRKDGSALSWGESYTLGALVDLYEATHKIRYLELVAQRGLQMLSHRDDYRKVVDGSGFSRPAWSTGLKYVVAEGVLKDKSGNNIIHIRSTPSAYNNFTKVEITRFLSRDEFDLRVTNDHFKRYEVFDSLSLNPKSKRFISKIVNDPMAPYSTRAGNYTEKSNLIRIESFQESNESLPIQSIELEPIPIAFMGYIGVIYHPLARFAEIVLNDSSLSQFKSTAEKFVRSIGESYEDASNRLWRNGPNDGEGYYLMCEKGESFPADNVGQPFNYLGKHVSVELAMYRLTGKPEYKVRSEKMIRLFKNRLKYDEKEDLYYWYYWYEPITTTGWKPEDSISYNVKYYPAVARVEDVSHGALDIELVMNAYRMGIQFTEKDMLRFSNTLIKNVILEDHSGVSKRVNGEGEYPRYLNSLYRWLILAEVNPQVYYDIKKTYFKVGKENLRFSAHLLKWKNIIEN